MFVHLTYEGEVDIDAIQVLLKTLVGAEQPKTCIFFYCSV